MGSKLKQHTTLKRDFKNLVHKYERIFVKVEVMSKSERASKAETAFKLFDKNRDGFITREEFTQVCVCFRKISVCCLDYHVEERNHHFSRCLEMWW